MEYIQFLNYQYLNLTVFSFYFFGTTNDKISPKEGDDASKKMKDFIIL